MLSKSTWHEPLLVLEEDRAADLMVPCPLSIRASSSVSEALRLLTNSAFGAAPVVDEHGRPVGVVSRADLLDLGNKHPGALVPAYYTHPSLEGDSKSEKPGGQPVRMGNQIVADRMAPVVFAVPFDTAPEQVVEKLLTWRLVRLLVTDRDGGLIGVLSTFDLLRRLRRCTAAEVPACFPEVDAE